MELFFSGMKLNIPGRNSYFYPDLMVGFADNKDPRFFQDAIFIAEVLSPGTRSFDMADKFLEYRHLPSLQYYLLAEPEYYHVTLQYKTTEGVWMSETYRKLTDIIKLPLMDADLPLAEMYKGLEWD
jgi:Uma2 family endonuclease